MNRRKAFAIPLVALAWASGAFAQGAANLEAVPLVLVVPKQSPYHSLNDLIAASRMNPGKLTVGTGSPAALAKAEQISGTADLRWAPVPYKNSTAALIDILAGHVDVGIVARSAAEARLSSGALRALPMPTLEKQIDAPKDQL